VWDEGSVSVRLATALVAAGKYAGLFAFPATLSAEYSFDQIPLARGLGDARALAGLAVLTAAAAAATRFFASRQRSLAACGVSLSLLAFLPVSNFLFALNVILAERLFYLPSVGLCWAGGSLLAAAPRRLPGRLGFALGAAVLVLLAARSVLRNPVWANDLVLFGQTSRDAPRCARVWARLGQLRAEAGRDAEARESFARALAIDPAEYAAHDGLGHLALDGAGPADAERLAEALRSFEAAARAQPRNPEPLYNASRVHRIGGRPDVAIESLEAALAIDPSHELSKEALAAAWQAAAVQEARAGDLAGAESTLVRGIRRAREIGAHTVRMEEMLAEVRRAREEADAPP
jgi:tetratricopeptide (TPR) repeat protein